MQTSPLRPKMLALLVLLSLGTLAVASAWSPPGPPAVTPPGAGTLTPLEGAPATAQRPPSLFASDAGKLLAHWLDLLAPTRLALLFSIYCPNGAQRVTDAGEVTEWSCPGVPNPSGYPGGGTSHLRFMVEGEDPFALALLLDEQDPEMSRAVHDSLLRSFERESCRCLPAENFVRYCQCPYAEVRLLEQRGVLGIMVIDDLELYVEHADKLKGP